MATITKYFTLILTICLLTSCTETKTEKVVADKPVEEKSTPRLERVSYQSEVTGKERDYYVYLPEGYDQQDKWPVMLFLHGNGERGDGKELLDYVFIHGPIFEAWSQKRNLPFVILVPQLPLFGQSEKGFIANRTKDMVPYPKEEGLNAYRPNYKGDELMNGIVSDSVMPYGKEGEADGWNKIEHEVLGMLDNVVQNFKGDNERVYLTGLSTGGFGVWYMGGTYPERFAAMAPITAFGHPDLAQNLVDSKMPLWVITGGRDPYVKMQYFYPALNKLEELKHPEVRFTVHEDMGHIAWQRAYEGNDLYDWFLKQKRSKK